jgi:hypothetical protein
VDRNIGPVRSAPHPLDEIRAIRRSDNQWEDASGKWLGLRKPIERGPEDGGRFTERRTVILLCFHGFSPGGATVQGGKGAITPGERTGGDGGDEGGGSGLSA